jgi:serine/threonine protein kinase
MPTSKQYVDILVRSFHWLIHLQNNVLVDSDRRARLADFGISSTSSATRTSATSDRGTVQYKAPELNKWGNTPTEESDVFALAHLLWEVGLVPLRNVDES